MRASEGDPLGVGGGRLLILWVVAQFTSFAKACGRGQDICHSAAEITFLQPFAMPSPSPPNYLTWDLCDTNQFLKIA